MIGWMDQVSFFVCGGMLILVVVGLVSAAVMPGMDRWNRRYFIVFFSVLVLCMSVFCVDDIVYGRPNLVTVEKVVSFLEYLLVSVLMPLSTVHLLHA